METLFSIILLVVGLVVYFIPTVIANKRWHKNTGPICIINIFFGWTFVGWIICIAWALSDNVNKKKKDTSNS